MLSRLFSSRLDSTWLIFFCGLVLFLNLGQARLFDEDEPKNAECGREMFVRGDWIVPTFNDELRTDKPIMIYWLMLISFNLFGVTEFSARLPSALMATGTILSLYGLGRHLFDRLTGMLAAVILGSSLMYVTVARASTPDATLIFFITLSLYLYAYWSLPSSQTSSAESGSRLWPAGFLPQHHWQYFVLYAVMACGVLSKGPVGFLLPCSIIGLTLLWLGYLSQTPVTICPAGWKGTFLHAAWALISLFHPRRFLTACLHMRLPWLLLALLLIALPWYTAVGFATQGEWLKGFLGGHNLGRFLEPMERHSGPIVYYIPVIMMGFFPWSAFLPLALAEAIFVLNQQARKLPACWIFLLSWVSVYVVFFSIAQTKLPNYVLPCYPALALLTSALLVRWQKDLLLVNAGWIKVAAASWIIVGIALTIGLPIASVYVLNGAIWLGLVGVVPLLAGTLLWWQLKQPDYLTDVAATRLPLITLASVLFILSTHHLASIPISLQQDGPYFGRLSQQLAGEDRQLGTFQYFAPNLVFYGEKAVTRLRDLDHLSRFLAEDEHHMALVRSDDFATFPTTLTDEVTIVERRPRFLRQHDLLLLQQSASPTRLTQTIPTSTPQ